MAELIIINGKYANENAIPNVIRYITRTRPNETRAGELIDFGACGASNTFPEMMIRQFEYIQRVYPSQCREPRRIWHEILSLDNQEHEIMMNAVFLLIDLAKACCQYYYYEMGFQAAYAVHHADATKRLHIHFAINTTSCINGKKRHESKNDFEQRRLLFCGWFQTYLRTALSIQQVDAKA